MAKDAKMIHLESDIQKIQVKTNMYIQEYGEQGTFHLAREIMQNDIDECLDDDSNGNTIEYSYDRASDILTCEDNGRGFSEVDHPMNIFCTTIQSGSKFFRAGNADSSGEFGVGMTVVNALSDFFRLESFREVEKTHHILEYNEGVLVKDVIKENKTGKHGTRVQFKASPKYMGENCSLPIEDVINWIDVMFYLNSENLKRKNITCKLTVYNGMTLEDSYKFKPKPFYELINKVIPADIKKKDLSVLMVLSGNSTFTENSKTLVDNDDGTKSVEMVPTEKHIHIDIALQYCTDIDKNDSATYDTYCNYTNTIKNGAHLQAFEDVFCRLIQTEANNSMSESQRSKYKITWDDIRTNLFCVLNLSSNAAVGFEGNQKESIRGSEELNSRMKELISSMLTKYFDENPSVLKEYVKIVTLTTKARVEAAKIKTASQTEKLNTFKEHELSNYIRCNNTGKQWKELFICEGNSASGSIRNACDPDTQAIFLLRGVVFNVIKSGSFSDAMNNNEWKNLTNILKCGAGPSFNLDKLYFDRINILTDADVDGYFISAGILAFFYTYMRPIIEAGKLYKVYSPLYSLNDKEYKFAADKADLIKIYHKKIVKNYKIKPISYDSYLSKDEFKDFLMDTYDYRETLIRSAKESGKINKFFLECVSANLVLLNVVVDDTNYDKIEEVFSNQKLITSIMSNIQKKFKEIKVDNTGRFYGPVEGKFTSIKISDRFYRKISDLIPIYKKYGYKLIVTENGKEPVEMTIGEFLDACCKLTPEIAHRFKGLAELNGYELHETTMDINNRSSIQYTVDDAKKELEIFQLTHGGSKENAQDRKELMKKYQIKREDLDN